MEGLPANITVDGDDESPSILPPGPAAPAATPEQVSEAVDGSLTGRLRAVGAQLRKTKTEDFPIPETPLVLRARAIRDSKSDNIRNELLVIKATAGLYLADEDDPDDPEKYTPIPGWGKELADLLDMRVEKATDLVKLVFDNPVRLQVFSLELVAWMAGRSKEDEQALGE
jgi:hypothetical protein